MSYTTKLYRITAQTHIHVGSGKQNYGIIDNLVQKDPVSSLPVIHGSSLKGALREFFVQKEGKDAELVKHVFGSENYQNKDNEQNTPGKYRFFDAHLLSLPIRSDKLPFVHASAPKTLSDLEQFLTNVGIKLNGHIGELSKLSNRKDSKACHFSQELKNSSVYLEDLDTSAKYGNGLPHEVLGNLIAGKIIDNTALVSNQTLKDLCDDNHLPVIARNSLENGRSANLWYEQIVPRQAVFYTLVMIPDRDEHETNFHNLLTGKQLIQIGANASIGYGFCKISEISTTNIA